MSRLVPFALLAGYGVAFCMASLGGSLLVFDDHPGQLYRVWHVVARGWAPWAWNAGWWAGYPELQFSPPGFAYAAALLHRVTLGALPVPAAYQAMLWIAYLAPGLVTFVVLARLLGDGWLALPGAFVALTLSAGVASGVEGGVRWGMVGSRLGWALLPLLALALARSRARAPTSSGAAVPLLAAIVLLHPAHLPTAVAMVVLGATRADPPVARARGVALTLGLAAAVTAFWTLPLLARLDNTRPLAWGRLSVREAVSQPLALVLIGLSLVALARSAVRAVPDPARDPHVESWSPGIDIVTRLPGVMLAVLLADALVAEPMGVRWLPANRVVDGAWLACVLAGGIGMGVTLAWIAARSRLRLPALSLLAVAAVIVLSLPGHSLTLWPRPLEWPTYTATARGLQLEGLWATLRGLPEGRVLFVRSGVPLVHGTAWYRPHTHITALTPLAGGRPIVHGTFTHPSPVAALVYRGSAGSGAITSLAEELDGHSLFGRPLAELDAATFGSYAGPFGISALVALDDDVPALRAFAESSEIDRRVASPPFVVYGRRAAVALPREVEADRWRVSLTGEAGEWVSARVAYYPLWRAEHDGALLPVRRGALGQLEVQLPRDRVTADLVYAPGTPELAGLGITALSVVAWLSLTLRQLRNRRLKTRASS